MQYIKIRREAGPSFTFPANAVYDIIAMTAVRSNSLMCSSNWNYIQVPVNIFPNTSVSWDMGDVRVFSTADSLCGSHAGQQNIQLFIIAVQSHRSVLNIRKSLSAPKPQQHRINDKGYCRPVNWVSTSYRLSPKVRFRYCLTVWSKWGDAPSCTNHMCWRWSRDIRSRVQNFPAWHTKAAQNGKCCEGYIVPSRVTSSQMWKVCWKRGRLCWKIANLFYFCHLKKLVRPETFGPHYVHV